MILQTLTVLLLSADAGAPTPPTPPAAAAAPTAKPVTVWAEGLQTPESVLYDAATDTYLVSNINGSPLEKDNNGFISKLKPDGTVVALKWIEAGKKGVTLNAPKGSAIAKGILYVADLDTVRKFDAKTGAPKGEVKLPGATFANDVAAGPDGKIYVTDSGFKGGAKGFEPSGTDAIWVIEGGKARALVKSDKLNHPNGVVVVGDVLYVGPFAPEGQLLRVDAKGEFTAAGTLPKGSLDGIVSLGGDLLISSWDAKAVFRGPPQGPFFVVQDPRNFELKDLEAPADIGFDSKRGRVLVPRFMGHAVEAFELK